MLWWIVILACLSAAAGAFVAVSWLRQNPRGTIGSGIAWRAARGYSRLVHRMDVRRAEHVPARDAGPMILVSNHTAGIDPILIQAACPCFTRFVMASDMRARALERVWRFTEVIFVDRSGKSADGIRDAIKHVKGGGVLAIFPEGGIERPAGTLRPFEPGVGLLVRRTGAPVVPIWIHGTPESPTAWGSLMRRSRAIVEFGPPMTFAPTDSPGEIAAALEAHYRAWTRWAMAAPAKPAQHVEA